jgi:hypothetical protein
MVGLPVTKVVGLLVRKRCGDAVAHADVLKVACSDLKQEDCIDELK